MNISRGFLTAGSVYLLVGIFIGIYMGGTQDHSLAPAHAHINLLGFAFMTIFGILYRIIPAMADNNLAGFTAKYTALNTGIAAYLTANPTDASALLANAERLKMVAEFQALKTESAALVTAIGG